MLYHQQVGEGEPLILLHGLFGTLENLGGITRLLAKHFRVYSLDLPNHGRSSRLKTMTLANMADAVVQWMDANQIDRAHCLGHSLGGKTMMEVALRYPERVKQLIVADIAPVTYPRRHEKIFQGLRTVNLAAITKRSDADQVLKNYVSMLPVRSFLLKNLVQDAGQWQWRMDLDVIERDYDLYLSANTDDKPAFEKPVLFLKGELSDYLISDYQQETLSRFPNAQMKVITGTGHWLHAEKPEQFVSLVLRFLQNQ